MWQLPLIQRCLVFIAVSWLAAGSSSADDNLRDSLVAKWNRQRDEIVTARLECQLLRLPVPANSRISPSDLEQSVGAHRLSDDWRDLKGFAEQLKLNIPDGKPLTGHLSFWMDGSNTRQTTTYEGAESSTLLFDGRVEMHSDPKNRQIQLYQPGEMGLGRMTIDSFRFIPALTEAARAEIVGRTSELVAVRAGRYRLMVFPKTGFVSRADFGNETNLTQIYQLSASSFNKQILFPSVRLKARFQRQKLKRIEMLIVNRCLLNTPIKREQFWLASVPGDKVFDHRKKRGEPAFFRVTQATSNIVAEADARRASGAVQLPKAPTDPGTPAGILHAQPQRVTGPEQGATSRLLLAGLLICLALAAAGTWAAMQRR